MKTCPANQFLSAASGRDVRSAVGRGVPTASRSATLPETGALGTARPTRPVPYVQIASRRRAFSLIEVMVAVTLLTVIIVGLLMMFNETQKAFRGSITQTDVLEAGRAASEMLAQELEQVAATHLNATNFFVLLPAAPLLQTLPGQAGVQRMNVLDDVFFLTCVNQQWYAIGYRVDPPGAGVGTLYRYYTNVPAYWLAGALTNFFGTASSNLSRVADGVVHFRVRARDLDGVIITTNIFVTDSYGRRETNIFAWLAPFLPPSGEYNYAFRSNGLPGAVELELGILEPPVLDRFRALTNNTATALSFLSERAAGVHLFRQLIPIRNADPHAYK
jgi:prepilin-type N-terminal cleavage/methylation domain-containing protein